MLTYDGYSSVFTGLISLENNGGFSSINREVESLPANVNSVTATFVGDGRRYQLRLMTLNKGNLTRYKHDFATVRGERTTRTFHFENFQAVFRGRLIEAPKVVATDIRQLGLLIADKTAGPFALNVDSVVFGARSSEH